MQLPLSDIEHEKKACRADLLANGRTVGDMLELPDVAYVAIMQKHGRQPPGLGDLVAMLAQPIAGAIDAILGTDLKNCPDCAKRKQKLNDL